MHNYPEKLLSFINESPTAFHAVESCKSRLLSEGFTELFENLPWSLEKNKGYFVTRNGSSILAFVTGSGGMENGVRGICAHTDSPSFKIKPNPEIKPVNGYLSLNTETYGGAIQSTWFDRPLALAGRVIVCDKNASNLGYSEILINIDKPVLIIPNLAIHFNRKINDGYTYNAQKDLLPLAGIEKTKGQSAKGNYIENIICENLNQQPNNILDFELFLYEYEKGSLIGSKNEFVSASRLDDLMMVYSGLEAISQIKNCEGGFVHTNIFCAFDNEEVGSKTMQGADSFFLRDVLKRICIGFGEDDETFYQLLASEKTMLLSADLAHGLHPNYKERHDPTNMPELGKGPVIKYSSNQRYATNAVSAAAFKLACAKAGVPYQTFVNRSDTTGGSTIGSILSSRLGINIADIGAPILAMHSIRELAASCDVGYTIDAFKAFLE